MRYIVADYDHHLYNAATREHVFTKCKSNICTQSHDLSWVYNL